MLQRMKRFREKFGFPGVADLDGVVIQDELGREILDGTPMAPPVGYKKQPSMVDIVRNMVRSERLKAEAEAAGLESFEDADDFAIADDEGELPSSPHENQFDPPVKELLKAGHEVVKDKAKKVVTKAVKVDKVAPAVDGDPQDAGDESGTV